MRVAITWQVPKASASPCYELSCTFCLQRSGIQEWQWSVDRMSACVARMVLVLSFAVTVLQSICKTTHFPASETWSTLTPDS